MINYPLSNISVGNGTLRVGCQLNVVSGQTDYHVGDCLRGELILHPYQDQNISRIEARLEFILQGPKESSRQHYSGILVCETLELLAPAQQRVRFDFRKPFPRANHLGFSPKGFWRLKITLHPEQPEGTVLNSIRKLGGKFNPVDTTFQVPVVQGKGQYWAHPKELKIKHVKYKEAFSLLFVVGFLFHMAFTSSQGSIINALPLLFLGVTLPIVALLLLRLYRFKDVPLELAETGDGNLKVRILDRGDGHWKNMELGYQVIAEQLEKGEKKSEITRRALFKTGFSLPDIARPREHFIEATLPWPEWPHANLPVSYQRDRQGYVWEIYLKTPGLLQEQVQTWPIAVSWEAFKLPEERVTEQKPEDVLELEPLKEPVRLNNEAAAD